ncbi:MAG TPA: signal peptidase I [Bdellovibrionales bacterium]|nr:MAG: signal peptidase I [Bdellovibrionales bacterium GWB1_52_6]OFZ05794.1 MAG: signal peptidase I [Bdellovibrionales bacterium GWA1_52_35]OFZ43678.1 MAG: signal peptidase I [Bdellovibrionales bacterium GWC1_52_8]HAR42208.1 signal peptidase I [Bdellovibrionales bacterium]HCM40265.1 signal peptidase I [Bdellovibrionales bacterium]
MTESNHKLIRDYGIAVIVAVLAALGIRSLVVEAYRIPSSAMKPTLEAGDTIFVSKSAYGLRLPFFHKTTGTSLEELASKIPERGDVVIFSLSDEPGRDFIKRVLGLPGETVEVQQGRISLNGKSISTTITGDASCGTETLPEGKSYSSCWEPPAIENFGPQKIPADSIFVLGDLRSSATEQGKTQAWRVIPLSSLKGKAIWVWLSIEPGSFDSTGIFPHFRLQRMFRRIE